MRYLPKKKDVDGAIGIGTLIIFIALILVAAIAAAVIIKTAEDLEERGEQTVDDAKKLVSATPQIKIAEGNVNTASEMDEVYLYIDLYGSDAVDMRNVVLHLIGTPNGASAQSADLRFNDADFDSTTSDRFATEEVVDPNNQFDPLGTPALYLLGERARLKLTIDLSATVGELPVDSSLEIWVMTTSSGYQTYDYYETPPEYPASGGIVSLEE